MKSSGLGDTCYARMAAIEIRGDFVKTVFSAILCLGLSGVALATSPAVAQTAKQAPPPLEAYGELPDIEDVSLSPNGRIALLGKVNGKRVVLMLDENRKPMNYALVGDIKVRSIGWAGEDIVIVQRTDTQELGDRFIAAQAEFSNSMLVPVDSSKPVSTVFADNRDILNANYGSYGQRLIDGRWYGYYAGLPMKRAPSGNSYYDGDPIALYRVDLAKNKADRIASGATNRGSRDWEIQADGSIGAYLDYFRQDHRWVLRNGSDKQLATDYTSEDGWASLDGFTRDGTGVVVRITNDDDDREWFSIPLGGGAKTKLFEDVDGTVETVYKDRYSRRMIGYALEDAPDEPIFFDEERQDAVRKVIQGFDAQNGKIVGWTPDRTKMLVTTNGNFDSGTWLLVDTTAGSTFQIGSERPAISPGMVGPISTFTYTAGDGLEIDAILTLPPGREAKDLPLVMLPHGGPQAHDEEGFDWWAQAFASRGYAVLQPNFRGSTDKDQAFVDKGNGEWGKKMQTDLSDGIAALTEKGIVDPSRACIVGASYGGYAAMAGITLQKDVYRCAVAVAGVSDLKRMVSREYNEGGSRSLRDFREETIGPRSEMDSISPAKLADQASAPILLIHGKDDTVVPYEQSTIMADKLKDAGKPYELVTLEGEDHWLSLSSTRLKMLAEAVRFVEKYNPAD